VKAVVNFPLVEKNYILLGKCSFEIFSAFVKLCDELLKIF